MSYELRAILEYDAARLEIIRLGNEIANSNAIFDSVGVFLSRKCTQSDDKPCFELLWDWNRQNAIYSYAEKHYDSQSELPDPPDEESPPELCECCKVTQQLVDDRKAARKRFGIAKVRLSRIARDHRNSTTIHADEL